MTRATLMAAVATLVLGSMAGCANTLAPAYQHPSLPVAPSWPGAGTSVAAEPEPQERANLTWQSMVADTTLQRVVELALANNRDLRLASLSIEKARAQYRIQRSELVPSVGGSLSGSSGRTPAAISSTGLPYTSHAYDLSVGITAWELDLFGRVRSLQDQALQDYLGTEAARQATRVGIVAEVISAYLRMSATQEQLTVARQTEKSRLEAYELQRHLHDSGNRSELELQQAQTELQGARDDVLVLDGTLAAARNALELLVGAPLAPELSPGGAVEAVLTENNVPVGLPGEVLQRRPDVLAAEHALRAAHANIGAARAAFFPRISLTAGVGRASDSLSTLFDGGSRAWSFLPQISVPIFTGGRLEAGLDGAKVEREAALARYELTIQTAFREVADALAVLDRIGARLSAQQHRLDAARQAHELVRHRYEAGVASYLEVLDAQRTLYAVQNAWIATRLARQINVVDLFRATGGDWSQAPRQTSVVDANELQT